MLFGRRQAKNVVTAANEPGAGPSAPGVQQQCPTLAKALKGIFRKSKPEILDLGPLCGDSVVRLADLGARVSVENFVPPYPTPPAEDGSKARTEPLSIPQPDEKFDLVLAWEHIDFVPSDRVDEFMAEIRRLTCDGGYALVFAMNGPVQSSQRGPRPDHLSRYRVVEEDQLVREIIDGPRRPRWVYPTRQIEQGLAPLRMQTLHLQRNQVREFLALKRAAR